MQDTLIVVSFDASIAALAARTLRSRQIFSTVLPADAPGTAPGDYAVRGLIFAATAQHQPDPALLRAWLDSAQAPVLALGGAVPALCRLYGGSCEPVRDHNGGVTLWLRNDALLADMNGGERVMHALSALTLPDTLAPLATATEQTIGFADAARRLYALQYPVERNDPESAQLLENFARNVCGVTPDWSEERMIERALGRIRTAAGTGKALCAVSGGVDSAVCAKLAHMALGERLVCVFIDTGLLRQGESDQVVATMMDSLGIVVAYVDAREAFLNALAGVSGERDKQRIVSSLLWQVLLKQIGYEPDVRVLLTGSTYTDRLAELAPDKSDSFAEDAPPTLAPLNELFKDEVRCVAEALSLPAQLANRQPFPESGLANRIVGAVTPERLQLLREIDALYAEEITAAGLEKRLWQYYAMLMPNPAEPYGDAILLRAVQESDGHAYAARLPYDLLERMVRRIRQQYPTVGRVVYDLSPSRTYDRTEAY